MLGPREMPSEGILEYGAHSSWRVVGVGLPSSKGTKFSMDRRGWSNRV